MVGIPCCRIIDIATHITDKLHSFVLQLYLQVLVFAITSK